ncbi:RidA family protein [Amphritea sp. 1_MG-2023]|uniref:RidA family protein n=1 Tax=Amphritea sp. 1_MG-2023 TaxID=3062670 RepID=UPI0026E1A501|nr:RidA family protein [Amphritea sp. 1_MG-2023]MDO6565393.1 RidA family protein [Amphritea sp. 1_MG-2023]
MIKRLHSNKTLSKIVSTSTTVYLAGQVADDRSVGVTEQTQQILAKVDDLLAEAGTDKTKLLSVIIWLADINEKDAMNKAWFDWIEPEHTPARACVESRLAHPDIRVEMKIEAAL